MRLGHFFISMTYSIMQNQPQDCIMDTVSLTHIWNGRLEKQTNFLLLGPESDEKTSLVKSILFSKFSINKCTKFIIFNGAENYKKTYGDIIDKVYTEYDSAIINEVLQNKISKKSTEDIVIVFDNLYAKFIKCESFERLFRLSKAAGINIIMTLQYAAYLKPEMREEFNYVCIFKPHDMSSRKRLYDYYGIRFSSFKEFNDIFERMSSCETIDVDIKYCTYKIVSQKIIDTKFKLDQYEIKCDSGINLAEISTHICSSCPDILRKIYDLERIVIEYVENKNKPDRIEAKDRIINNFNNISLILCEHSR